MRDKHPAPLATAVRLGLPLVDGDYGGGRAIPEIAQSYTALHGESVYPIAFVDYSGTVIILKEAIDYKMVERVGKMIGRASHSGKEAMMERHWKLAIPVLQLAVGNTIRMIPRADHVFLFDPETEKNIVCCSKGWRGN